MNRDAYKKKASDYRRYLRELRGCAFADNYGHAIQQVHRRSCDPPPGFTRRTLPPMGVRRWAAGTSWMPLVHYLRRHGVNHAIAPAKACLIWCILHRGDPGLRANAVDIARSMLAEDIDKLGTAASLGEGRFP